MPECLSTRFTQAFDIDEEEAADEDKGDVRVGVWMVGHERDEVGDGLIVLLVEHSFGSGDLARCRKFAAHEEPMGGTQRGDGVPDQGLTLGQRREGSSPEVVGAGRMNDIAQRAVKEVAEEAQRESIPIPREVFGLAWNDLRAGFGGGRRRGTEDAGATAGDGCYRYSGYTLSVSAG